MLAVQWDIRPAGKPTVTLAQLTFPDDLYGGLFVPVGMILPDGLGGRDRIDFVMSANSESICTVAHLPDLTR